MRVLRCCLPVLALLAGQSAFADLYISPALRDSVHYQRGTDGEAGAKPAARYGNEPHGSDRSESSSVVRGYSDIHGNFEMGAQPDRKVPTLRYGVNVPLFVALESIVPSRDQWRVNFDDGTDNLSVSWNGGTNWKSVIRQISEENQVAIVINENEQAIGISRDAELARYLARQDPQLWRLQAGKTLRQNLAEWCAKIGWTLTWDETLRVDYPIQASAVITGPFDGEAGSVAQVMRAFQGNAKPLRAEFYKANRVLRITDAGHELNVEM